MSVSSESPRNSNASTRPSTTGPMIGKRTRHPATSSVSTFRTCTPREALCAHLELFALASTRLAAVGLPGSEPLIVHWVHRHTRCPACGADLEGHAEAQALAGARADQGAQRFYWADDLAALSALPRGAAVVPEAQAEASLRVRGLVHNAGLIEDFSGCQFGAVEDLTPTVAALEASVVGGAARGARGRGSPLVAQAATLNAIFARCATAASRNLEGLYLDATDRYLRLALRAQRASK